MGRVDEGDLIEYCDLRDNFSADLFLRHLQRINDLELGAHFSLAMIKTMLMQWCTTGRFQELRPCPFCGAGRDAMSHFLKCDKLWAFIGGVYLAYKVYHTFKKSDCIGMQQFKA
eukprot:5638145-Karenia_brevis.AAC.1